MNNDYAKRITGFYADHCAGCGRELSDVEGKSEFVAGIDAVRRWDDGCYAARAEYLSMELAPDEVRNPKSRQPYSQHTGWECPSYDGDYDPYFDGMNEYEFLGDVGDK